MDYPSTLLGLAAASVAYIVVGVAAALLLLYGVIRVAVARGMRDHHKWLEKNRAAPSESRAGRVRRAASTLFASGGSLRTRSAEPPKVR